MVRKGSPLSCRKSRMKVGCCHGNRMQGRKLQRWGRFLYPRPQPQASPRPQSDGSEEKQPAMTAYCQMACCWHRVPSNLLIICITLGHSFQGKQRIHLSMHWYTYQTFSEHLIQCLTQGSHLKKKCLFSYLSDLSVSQVLLKITRKQQQNRFLPPLVKELTIQWVDKHIKIHITLQISFPL